VGPGDGLDVMEREISLIPDDYHVDQSLYRKSYPGSSVPKAMTCE
jgi:hypothetical protein